MQHRTSRAEDEVVAFQWHAVLGRAVAVDQRPVCPPLCPPNKGLVAGGLPSARSGGEGGDRSRLPLEAFAIVLHPYNKCMPVSYANYYAGMGNLLSFLMFHNVHAAHSVYCRIASSASRPWSNKSVAPAPT